MSIDVKKLVGEYISKQDWRVNENANMGYCASSLLLHAAGRVMAEYGLEKIYKGMPIADMHRVGKVHIHDLSGSPFLYCSGWSLKKLLDTGFFITDRHVCSNPPKHLRSAMNQIVNFFGSISNECMGAVAFSDLDTYLSAYMYKDYIDIKNLIASCTNGSTDIEHIARVLIEKEVRQSIQELMFSLNFPSRWGAQSPFTNVTLALGVPDDMKDMLAIVDNKPLKDEFGNNLTYSDLIDWIYEFDRIFFEIVTEGDANGKVFTFPIITVNVTEDFFNLDRRVLDPLLASVAKYGSCYFQNVINGYSGGRKISTDNTRAFCCRLQLDLDELSSHAGGLFGHGENTGSIGVVTLNLPWIGYESDTKEDLFLKLGAWIKRAGDSLYKKRLVVTDNLQRGLFPYMARYLNDLELKTFFCTIGYVGLHECLLNFGIEDGIISEEGHSLAKDILDFMLKEVKKLQKEYGCLFNLEATPAEGASYRLAKLAKETYPDIITSGTDERPYFTNSCHLPAEKQDDFVFMIKHQEELQIRHSGGTTVHFYVAHELEPEMVLNMIRVVTKSKIPYFSITPTFSICPICGYLPGVHKFCPNEHTKEELERYGVVV